MRKWLKIWSWKVWCSTFHRKHWSQYWTEFSWFFWRCELCNRHWKTPRAPGQHRASMAEPETEVDDTVEGGKPTTWVAPGPAASIFHSTEHESNTKGRLKPVLFGNLNVGAKFYHAVMDSNYVKSAVSEAHMEVNGALEKDATRFYADHEVWISKEREALLRPKTCDECGRIYDREDYDLDLKVGDKVIYESWLGNGMEKYPITITDTTHKGMALYFGTQQDCVYPEKTHDHVRVDTRREKYVKVNW